MWPRPFLDNDLCGYISKTCVKEQFNLMIRLEKALKTFLQDVSNMYWRRFEDVFKTFWRHLEGVWPWRKYWSWPRRLKNVLKMSSENAWIRRIYSTWSKSFEDVLKMSSEDEDERKRRKTKIIRLYQDEFLLGCSYIAYNRFAIQSLILLLEFVVHSKSRARNCIINKHWVIMPTWKSNLLKLRYQETLKCLHHENNIFPSYIVAPLHLWEPTYKVLKSLDKG